MPACAYHSRVASKSNLTKRLSAITDACYYYFCNKITVCIALFSVLYIHSFWAEVPYAFDFLVLLLFAFVAFAPSGLIS
ncbi:hypothetical protein A9165_01265 [Alishewanella sp. HH-ZS]|nr:hypothetical protein A9165_01265 [Alishewanella sp. HH-ZS]